MIQRGLLIVIATALAACAGPGRGPASIPTRPDIQSVAALMDSGQLTSEELTTELLARISRQQSLNAFITLNPNALETARERDRQRAAGRVRGPLHGIALVIKDNIHVAGLPNTAGTPALKDFVPDTSNETVARLLAAGAIVLGKTNLHELAFGITSDNAAFGAVGNPVDPSLFPGGSSGGTAAAIAAGMAPAGLGTDTGGSVRIPAALTGISGFRPSLGRYPSGRVTPISHTRDTVGVMAATVTDLALLDRVITGSRTDNQPPAADQVRLGIIKDYYLANLEPETQQVFEAALTRLRAAGVTVVDVEFPALGELVGAGFPIALYEAHHDLTDYLETFDTNITLQQLAAQVASPDVKGVFGIVAPGDQIPEAAYQQALKDIEVMQLGFVDLFTGHNLDAVVFPTTPLTARPIEGSVETVSLNGQQVPTFATYIRNTDPASLAGLPGLSMPAGTGANGLPVGLEIDGAPGSDARLLQVALLLEQLLRQ